MLKNVTLLPDTKNGKRTWKLLGPTGDVNEPFSIFAKSVSSKNGRNTLENYCRHLAQFFDYLYEASTALHLIREDALLTSDALLDIVEAYDEYLVYGHESGNEVAQIVARTLPSPRNTRQTSAIKHAPVRRFLKLSDQIHRQTLELVNAGLLQRQESPRGLLDMANLKHPPSAPQRQALLGNSMLAGVIAGGSKLVPSTVLPVVTPQAAFDSGRAFPFDRIQEFIETLPKHRDRAFYSLLAASGCRTHEGLQLLFDDIEVDKREVFLVEPATRPNCSSYLYLTPDERHSLSWKGRTTSITFLIEPFASMFFTELASYLREEYVPHGLHKFVFQYRFPQLQGRPFYLSDSDIMSWKLCEEVLHHTLQRLKSGMSTARWVVQMPEAVIRDLKRVNLPSSVTAYTLARLQECIAFPTLESPHIRARFELMRRQLLAKSGRLDEALASDFPSNPAMECAGLLKTIVESHKIGYDEIVMVLEGDGHLTALPDRATPMLTGRQ